MTTEFGIFNEEGLIEGDFYSYEEAMLQVEKNYDIDDDLYVAEVCLEHREFESGNCEICDIQEEEEDNE